MNPRAPRLHRPYRRRRPARLALPAAGLAALWLLAAACSAPAEKELKGPLGPGDGGPAVNGAAVVSHDLTNAAGDQSIGALLYDGSRFLHYHPDPESPGLHIIANILPDQLLADLADEGEINGLGGDDIVIALTPIIGRPDTPCRFQAALIARDKGYEILAAGDRRNDLGLELHEVDLTNRKIPAAQRFYCYQLRDPLGVQVNAITADEAHQTWLIVHHVLNAVTK